MTIFLLRHAESTSNASNAADSQMDADLSLLGRNESKKLAEILAARTIDVVYVSPLKRTKQTVEPYLQLNHQLKVLESPLLLERDLGDFTGSRIGDFQKYCDERGLDRVQTRPKNGESLVDVCQRARDFLSVVKLRSEENLLICASKNILMCLQISIEQKDLRDYYSYPAFEPAELRQFKI